MKHRHSVMTALFGLMFLFLSYSSFVYSASFEVVDDLWVTDRTGVGTTAPYGLLQVGTLPTTPGLIVTIGNNVGIGTTAPGAALEVAGQVKITGGTPGANKVLTSDANGLANWQTPNGGGWSDDGATVRLSTDTDNVGIGLTNAGANLHLSGAGTTTGFAFRIADTTPTDRLVVQDSGNLGLGTTAPAALLQLQLLGSW